MRKRQNKKKQTELLTKQFTPNNKKKSQIQNKQQKKVQTKQKIIENNKQYNQKKRIKKIVMSSLDKILKIDGNYTGDLVSVDFKSQSLHKFLQTIVLLINQHSQKINCLEIQKISMDMVKTGNYKLFQANKLSENILSTLIHQPNKFKMETYQEIIDGLANNMKLNIHSIQHIYDHIKNNNQQISNINSQLTGFQKIDQVNENLKKINQNCKKYTDEELVKVLNRLKDFQIKTTKKMSEYENLIKQTQKKTIWKINQCQSHLTKKITSDYVDKAIQQVQIKIYNNIKNDKYQQTNNNKYNLQIIQNKIQKITTTITQNEKQNKNILKNLQNNQKLYQKKDKIQHDKIQYDLKIKQIYNKIYLLEKRQDPKSIQFKFNNIISQHQSIICQYRQKFIKLENQCESILNLMSQKTLDTGMDPHKLCQIDGQVRRLRSTSKTCETKLSTLQEQIKAKMLIFEQRIVSTINSLKNQESYINKQQFYQSLNRIRQSINITTNDNHNLISQLNMKINKLQLFEKATKKKMKSLTKYDENNKILDMKLGVDQNQIKFTTINIKLQNFDNLLNQLKIQIQSNKQFLQNLKKQINKTEQGINIFGAKQKIFPVKCLSCGYKHNPVYQNNMMIGTDNKYYKVDFKSTYPQTLQVYGVSASQIGIVDSTNLKKSRLYTSTRPHSSKPYLRPASAQKH